MSKQLSLDDQVSMDKDKDFSSDDLQVIQPPVSDGNGVSPNLPLPPSKVQIESFFPTKLAYQDWPDAPVLNAYLKERIYALQVADPLGIKRSNYQSLGAWHSTFNIHDLPEFAEFTDRVTATVEDYLNQIGSDPAWKAICAGMWANISPKYGYNRSHRHGTNLLSGVYYVQAKPSCSGSIYFEDPREQALVLPHYTEEALKSRSHTWNQVSYDPIPGRIILFPSWLRHEVSPNLDDTPGREGDRISISFNFCQKLRQGSE